MRYRLMFGVGLAVGYVLGSRAGRERYEQLKRMAHRLSDNPSVQEAAAWWAPRSPRPPAWRRTR
ncbi:hypothetical protein ACFQX6_26645 [Streptosporangium lutulentum]